MNAILKLFFSISLLVFTAGNQAQAEAKQCKALQSTLPIGMTEAQAQSFLKKHDLKYFFKTKQTETGYSAEFNGISAINAHVDETFKASLDFEELVKDSPNVEILKISKDRTQILTSIHMPLRAPSKQLMILSVNQEDHVVHFDIRGGSFDGFSGTLSYYGFGDQTLLVTHGSNPEVKSHLLTTIPDLILTSFGKSMALRFREDIESRYRN